MSKNSIEDLKSRNLWLAAVAEFIGTLLLVLVGCGSCGRFKVNVQEFNSTSLVDTEKLLPNDLVQISLCFGLSVATIVWSIAHVSGGHINPGVTIGFFVTRKISLARTLVYMIFQVIGALLGALFLKIVTPPGVNDSLGSTLLGANVSLAQGLVIEMFITFVLVWTVFSTCDSNRTGLSGSGPLAIGLSIAMCHLWAVSNCFVDKLINDFIKIYMYLFRFISDNIGRYIKIAITFRYNERHTLRCLPS